MIDGLRNFRDTGGTSLAGGGVTNAGVLYRSEALSELSPLGLEQLAASEIGVIVDFRTPVERGMQPDVVPSQRPFRMVQLSILEGAMGDRAGRSLESAPGERPDAAAMSAVLAQLPTLSDLYIGMLQHGASAFAEVARLVGDSTPDQPTAVLVHCTAGKDRTGVAVALLLQAAGAERDAIIADYSSSERHLAGPWADAMLGTVERMGAPLTPQLTELLTRTPAAAMRTALAWVESTHGGGAGYLRSGGLTEAELERLRSRLAG